MEAIEGLLQTRDRGRKEPIASATKLEALEEGVQARGEGGRDRIQKLRCDYNEESSAIWDWV